MRMRILVIPIVIASLLIPQGVLVAQIQGTTTVQESNKGSLSIQSSASDLIFEGKKEEHKIEEKKMTTPEEDKRRFEEEQRQKFEKEGERRMEEEGKRFKEEDRRFREEERRSQDRRMRKDEGRKMDEGKKFEGDKSMMEGDQRFRDDEKRQKEDEKRFEEEEKRREEEDKRHEEEEKRMEERRFQDMKRNVKRFTSDITRMERESERSKKRMERCGLELPSEIAKTLENAKSLVAKVETAKTADELEDVMSEFEDVGFNMGEFGRQMGPLQQMCEMLSRSEQELKKLTQDQDRFEKRAEQQKIDVSVSLGKLRELARKMEEALGKARELAKTDAESAVMLLEDEFFSSMEEYRNAQRAVEMALDMSRGLKDADREIREFKNRVKELKSRKKDTAKLERLIAKMEKIKAKLDDTAKRGELDPEEMGATIEEVFDAREEFVRLASHLDGGQRFESEEKFKDEDFTEGEDRGTFKLDLPEGFKPTARTRAIKEAVREGTSTDIQIKDIKETAELLSNDKLDAILGELKQLRSQVKEQESELKYMRKLTQDFSELSEKMQEKLNAFVTYGVDANSSKLGEGERAAVLNSYKAAFQALPEDEQGLEDVIKIVNGRFPNQRSGVAEKQAKKTFQDIFKRVANMNNEKDKAAIMVMAYGLRQAAGNRKLESEQRGIATFKNIFNALPSTTEEWNAMQAITYSGATRKADSDKDLLADEDEKALGTDPKNPDTDGDGIPDGTEVDEEFDPLKK